MADIERICKRNGQDVIFYQYGIFGEQEEVVPCNHLAGKGNKTGTITDRIIEVKKEKEL